MIYCLEPEAVIEINRGHCARTGEPHSVRDRKSLERALSRPLHGFGGHVPFGTPVEKAAALLESVLQEHPFTQGNKRTGWTVATVYLSLHGYGLEASDNDAVSFALDTAKGLNDAQAIALWFGARLLLQ